MLSLYIAVSRIGVMLSLFQAAAVATGDGGGIRGRSHDDDNDRIEFSRHQER